MAIAPRNHLKFDFARNASVILQEKVVKIYDVGQCLDCIREIAVKPEKKTRFYWLHVSDNLIVYLLFMVINGK